MKRVGAQSALAFWVSVEGTICGELRVSLVVQAGYDDVSLSFDSVPKSIRKSLNDAAANILDDFSVGKGMFGNPLDGV